MRVTATTGTGRALTRRAAAMALAALLGAPMAVSDARAQGSQTQSFQTLAPHAILIDADTGAVLFEKGADEPFSPASMAKLMTVEVLFDEMRKGKLGPDTVFTISENAWRRGGAGGGARRCSPSSTAR